MVTPLEPLGPAGPEVNASVKLVSYGKQGRFLELVFLKALIADGARGLRGGELGDVAHIFPSLGLSDPKDRPLSRAPPPPPHSPDQPGSASGPP